ncbi:MAG: hypothetical protein Q9220_007315 [cf. Caloplaca sp. 1 TL-2023]
MDTLKIAVPHRASVKERATYLIMISQSLLVLVRAIHLPKTLIMQWCQLCNHSATNGSNISVVFDDDL